MSKEFAVLAWAVGEGYMGIESFHDSYSEAERRTAILYRTARRVFRRPNYPSHGDHWFIPVDIKNFRNGENGDKYPEGFQYTPYWD